MLKPWEKVESEPKGHFDVFSVRRDRLRSPRTGEVHTFHVIESGPWVNVIPVTADGKVVCIRQHRHGIGHSTLEIPGGMVDDGEPPEHAARRELLEETGYTADEVVYLGRVAPNPAIQNNYCYTYLARNARPTGTAGDLDDAEDIAVELVDLARIPHLIAAEEISHGLVVAAFYLYEHSKRLAHPQRVFWGLPTSLQQPHGHPLQSR